ncbi:MAG: ribulokinase [Pirellula sp.]
MNKPFRVVLGLDFGTESVRALLADTSTGEIASASAAYDYGQILDVLPGSQRRLAPLFALQQPRDWLEASAKAIRAVLRKSKVKGEAIAGIGVDFTSCTMLPAKSDGTPLCWLEELRDDPFAWPKLWKHHGAQSQTDRINKVARTRDEKFLHRYGGVIGLEWFFPKILETLEEAPNIYRACDVWLEAGDWFVWQLVGGPAASLPRSTCQAGYKGMWNAQDGFPSEAYFKAVHSGLKNVVKDKMPGKLIAPGRSAGGLCKSMAKNFGLKEGIPVSAAIIDAHAGVPGAGAAEPGTLVMVMGTSSCHMLNSEREELVAGVAGVVKDGILPGYYGYETGQAAVGDAFDWLRRLSGHKDFNLLSEEAKALPAGSEGVLCLDWYHGCRTPLMDGSLRGALTGLGLQHRPAHLYRAIIEGSAMGLRWIVELLREGGVDVRRFVATGGLPHHNPLVVQVYADVLGESIMVHPSTNGPALGAAILGALAADLFDDSASAIRAMSTPAKGQAKLYKPIRANQRTYDRLYTDYRRLGDFVVQSNPTR